MPKGTAAPVPFEAVTALEGIGRALRTSRLARRETIATAAERVGVADSTWQRIEAGDPSVGSGVLFAALVAYGYTEALMNLADESHDTEGQALQRQRMSMRGST